MPLSLVKYILIVLGLSLYLPLSAQQLEVKRVELSGDDIIVHYALTDTVPGRTFSVNLYSSHDNYVNPLTSVMGDFGIEVKPGIMRKVIWNAKQELGANFDGKVSIELRARPYIPFLRFDAFDKIKRGKPTEVTWRGGTPQNILNFELWRKGKRVVVTPNIPNAQHAKIEIPRSVKAGKGYTFRIIDSKNKDLAIETAPFAVKPQMPLLIKLLPVLAAGAIISTLGSSGAEGPIPDPIGMPSRQ
jgi:hypothetical protein